MNSDHVAAKSRESKRAFPEPGQDRKVADQKRDAGESRHYSDLLDAALDDTFPGSDAVSITQPVGKQSE
jgi:hypothetical protein